MGAHIHICTFGLIEGGADRYRRGKPESNDVDIVFTHPDGAKVKGLCKRFVKHLHSRGTPLPSSPRLRALIPLIGMVTHVMRTPPPPLPSPPSLLSSSLSQALTRKQTCRASTHTTRCAPRTGTRSRSRSPCSSSRARARPRSRCAAGSTSYSRRRRCIGRLSLAGASFCFRVWALCCG